VLFLLGGKQFFKGVEKMTKGQRRKSKKVISSLEKRVDKEKNRNKKASLQRRLDNMRSLSNEKLGKKEEEGRRKARKKKKKRNKGEKASFLAKVARPTHFRETIVSHCVGF
jgi:hypothetical protein